MSPLRIGFAGGGTDLEEYHNKYEGATISATIDKFTYVFARLRNDKKLQSFSPDFASHLPPKTFSKIAPPQGHEIVLSCLKEMKFSKGIDMFFVVMFLQDLVLVLQVLWRVILSKFYFHFNRKN